MNRFWLSGPTTKQPLRVHVKRIACLASAPPPKLLADARFSSYFYMNKYISFWNKKSLKWMILKFKKLCFWRKNTSKNLIMFVNNFVSEHSKHFFFEKKLPFLEARGSTPPPLLADASAKNARFFYVLPYSISVGGTTYSRWFHLR